MSTKRNKEGCKFNILNDRQDKLITDQKTTKIKTAANDVIKSVTRAMIPIQFKDANNHLHTFELAAGRHLFANLNVAGDVKSAI